MQHQQTYTAVQGSLYRLCETDVLPPWTDEESSTQSNARESASLMAAQLASHVVAELIHVRLAGKHSQKWSFWSDTREIEASN